jgi:ABC-type bacteriocin/lantibiotic exporter with double-glycine peptidase domain
MREEGNYHIRLFLLLSDVLLWLIAFLFIIIIAFGYLLILSLLQGLLFIFVFGDIYLLAIISEMLFNPIEELLNESLDYSELLKERIADMKAMKENRISQSYSNKK